eukprot:2178561-Prymnesium_polylepis.1
MGLTGRVALRALLGHVPARAQQPIAPRSARDAAALPTRLGVGGEPGAASAARCRHVRTARFEPTAAPV